MRGLSPPGWMRSRRTPRDAAGLEPELSVVVDVMFPMAALTEVAKAFLLQFPRTPLRLYIEALGGTVQPVLDGRCGFGIVGSLPFIPPQLSTERLASVLLMMVASENIRWLKCPESSRKPSSPNTSSWC